MQGTARMASVASSTLPILCSLILSVGSCSRPPVNRTIHVLCILLVLSQAAHALSYFTPDGIFAQNMASCAEVFSKEHAGRSPTSWADFQPYFQNPIDETFRHITPTKRYAFLSRPLHLPPPYDGDLLIVTRRPFRDGRLYTNWYGGISHGLREPGRYIIFRTGAGTFHAYYVEEAYVQQAFRGSESLLPSPDTEPERPRESEARRRSIISWAVAVLVAGAFLARLFFRRSAAASGNARNA